MSLNILAQTKWEEALAQYRRLTSVANPDLEFITSDGLLKNVVKRHLDFSFQQKIGNWKWELSTLFIFTTLIGLLSFPQFFITMVFSYTGNNILAIFDMSTPLNK